MSLSWLLQLADAGGSDPVTTLFDFLTADDYAPLRTALRDLCGAIAGAGSGVYAMRRAYLEWRSRMVPTRLIVDERQIAADQNIVRYLSRELSEKDAEIARLSDELSRQRGVSETLRAIVNEDELPVPEHPVLPPASD